MGPVLRHLYAATGIQRGPETPKGVFARVVEGRTLYVNTTKEEVRIPIFKATKGLISGREFKDAMVLGPMDADLIP